MRKCTCQVVAVYGMHGSLVPSQVPWLSLGLPRKLRGCQRQPYRHRCKSRRLVIAKDQPRYVLFCLDLASPDCQAPSALPQNRLASPLVVSVVLRPGGKSHRPSRCHNAPSVPRRSIHSICCAVSLSILCRERLPGASRACLASALGTLTPSVSVDPMPANKPYRFGAANRN